MTSSSNGNFSTILNTYKMKLPLRNGPELKFTFDLSPSSSSVFLFLPFPEIPSTLPQHWELVSLGGGLNTPSVHVGEHVCVCQKQIEKFNENRFIQLMLRLVLRALHCFTSSLAFNSQASKSLLSTNLCCQVNDHWCIFSAGLKCSMWSVHLCPWGVRFDWDSKPCCTYQSPERQYIPSCSKWDFYLRAKAPKK